MKRNFNFATVPKAPIILLMLLNRLTQSLKPNRDHSGIHRTGQIISGNLNEVSKLKVMKRSNKVFCKNALIKGKIMSSCKLTIEILLD